MHWSDISIKTKIKDFLDHCDLYAGVQINVLFCLGFFVLRNLIT